MFCLMLPFFPDHVPVSLDLTICTGVPAEIHPRLGDDVEALIPNCAVPAGRRSVTVVTADPDEVGPNGRGNVTCLTRRHLPEHDPGTLRRGLRAMKRPSTQAVTAEIRTAAESDVAAVA